MARAVATVLCVLLCLSISNTSQSQIFLENEGSGIAAPGFKEGGSVATDLNVDGFPDLLITQGSVENGADTTLLFHYSPTTGAFVDVTDGYALELNTVAVWRDVVAADFNNDGAKDLALVLPSEVRVLFNGGRGAVPAYSFETTPFIYSPLPPNVADFNGIEVLDYDFDGRLDLVVSGDGVTLLRNTADGGFVAVSTESSGLPGFGLEGDTVSVVDLARNGRVDILARSTGPDLFLNTGGDGGTFDSVSTFDLPVPVTTLGESAFCDLDNDGDFDILWTGTNEVFENRNSEGFVDTGLQFADPANTVAGVDCVDVDNDGDLDVFVTQAGADTFLRNDTVTEITFTEGTGPTNVGLGFGIDAVFDDFDLDGDLDFVVSEAGGAEMWLNQTDNTDYLMVEVTGQFGHCSDEPIVRSMVGATVTIGEGGVRSLGTSNRVHFGGELPAEPQLFVKPPHPNEPIVAYALELDGPYRSMQIAHRRDLDNDGILNTEEFEASAALDNNDVDGDGTPNWLDTDSDGDGMSDALEAGDDDYCTIAADKDDNGVRDYLEAAVIPAYAIEGGGCRCAVGAPQPAPWRVALIAGLCALLWVRRQRGW